MLKYDQKIDMTTDNSISLILRNIIPGSKVLEFGPATGYMTRYMKEELNCTIYCVEIDPESAKVASRYCEKMILSDLDQMEWVTKLKEDRFDHIIFADVLEHLVNPWEVLKSAASFLKKGGSILTSIPNIGHNAVIMELLQGNFEYRSLGLLDNTHLRFFTKKSILNLFDKAGLSPVKWLATVSLPEQTEFKQAYSSFPKAFQEILKNKEDGDIYQYVTVTKRKEDVTIGEHCTDFSNTKKPACGFLQVFWGAKDGFVESKSTKVPLEYDEKFFQFDVKLPPEALTSGCLRVDPCTKPAYLEIESIELYTGEQIRNNEIIEPLSSYTMQNNFSGIHAGHGVECIDISEKYRFISIDEDPQIYLEFKQHHIVKSPVFLRIKYHYTENVVPAFINQMNEFRNKISLKKDALRMKEDELTRKADKLALLQKELEYKDTQLHEQKLELINLQQKLSDIASQFSGVLEENSSLQSALTASNSQLERQSASIQRLQEEVLKREEQLLELYSSKSWRLMMPLRWITQFFKR